jgi:hypothetical protein
VFAGNGAESSGNSIEAFSTRMWIGAHAVTAAARFYRRCPVRNPGRTRWPLCPWPGFPGPQRRHRCILFGRAGVMNDQARPSPGKTQGNRATDFAAGAGYQGGTARAGSG